VVNSVLPDFIISLGVEPEKQGYVSSMGLFKQMFDNSGDIWRSFGPQWCVDAVDTALLHIAGLVCPGTKCAQTTTSQASVSHANTISEPDPDEGVELSNVVAREKAEDLLRWMGKPGWRPLDDVLKEVSDPLIQISFLIFFPQVRPLLCSDLCH
jgi:hypothetical protein